MSLSDHPKFEALAEVAKRGLLAPETWHCNRPYINLKTMIDVPLLGTVIEQNGDGCLEDSFFPSDASWLSPGRSTRSIACCRDE